MKKKAILQAEKKVERPQKGPAETVENKPDRPGSAAALGRLFESAGCDVVTDQFQVRTLVCGKRS